jgi:two-component system sensor kinase FixL
MLVPDAIVALVLTMAALLLVTQLLVERRRRFNAQAAMNDHLAYDRLISDLTDDLAFHETSTSPRSLQGALARLGRYVGADRVVLAVRATSPFEKPRRLAWTREDDDGDELPFAHVPRTSTHMPNGGTPVVFPMFANGVDVGTLELYSPTQPNSWPGPRAPHVQAAAEIVASALASGRALRAERRTEELNHVVLASLSAQIAILDRQGVIVHVNEAWREVADRGGVGLARDAFVGTSYLEECRRAAQRGATEAGDVAREIQTVLAGGSASFRLEYHCPPPGERWYEFVVDRLEREAGGAVVMHLDITTRRLAERSAEEGRRQVEHMGRVVATGKLAAALSHELRQPLSAIRCNAQAGIRFLRSGTATTDEMKAILDDIVADDSRAATVMERIRAMLRNEAPTSQPVDLNDVCRSVGAVLGAEAALQDARLVLELESALPRVRGDVIQLQQVVLNLVLNGLEAAALSPRRREVTVKTAVSGAVVELSVRDSGCGIPPEAEHRLFESFFSTKENGLGLGLSIVRSIAEQHGGSVRAGNAADAGAIFYVTLPAEGTEAPVVVG